MPDSFAIDMDFWNRLQPKIRQYEITHGVSMPKDQYQALVEGELGVATKTSYDRAARNEALAIDREKMDAAKDQADKADRAAKVSGIVSTGTTLGTGYLGYKQIQVNKENAAANRALADKISGNKPAVDVNTPAPTTPTTTPGATEFSGAGAQTQTGQNAVDLSATDYASYDAAMAEGASEGVGSSANTTAAPEGGSAVGGAIVGAAASLASNYLVTKTGEGKKSNARVADWSRYAGMTDLSDEEYAAKGSATVGGIAGGAYTGGPVGAAWGAAIGATIYDIGNLLSTGKVSNELIGIPFADKIANTNVNSIFDTVICTELLRQGKISRHDKTACVVFRFRHIPSDMFDAYLEWATPVVAVMRNGGLANRILLPFAKAFIGYMLSIQAKRVPSFMERMVWKYAWWRCEAIAKRVEVMAHA